MLEETPSQLTGAGNSLSGALCCFCGDSDHSAIKLGDNFLKKKPVRQEGESSKK